MNQPPQPSRVRSSLFNPPAIAPEAAASADPAATDPSAEIGAETESAPAAVELVKKPARPRRPRNQDALLTLQIRLPAAIHLALKVEALKRRQSVSALVARAMAAQFPSVAAAAKPAA